MPVQRQMCFSCEPKQSRTEGLGSATCCTVAAAVAVIDSTACLALSLPWPCCAVFAVLCCAVLHYTLLCYTLLCFLALLYATTTFISHTTLQPFWARIPVQYASVCSMYCIASHRVTLCCTVLCCTVLYCIVFASTCKSASWSGMAWHGRTCAVQWRIKTAFSRATQSIQSTQSMYSQFQIHY